MKDWWSRRLWPAWLVLTLLTLTSARVGEADGLTDMAIALLFAIAAVKAHLVLETFMEAARAERHWRWLYRTWIGVITTMLIGGLVIFGS